MKSLLQKWLGIDGLLASKAEADGLLASKMADGLLMMDQMMGVATPHPLMSMLVAAPAPAPVSAPLVPEWLGPFSKFWCVSFGPDQYNPNNVPYNQLPYFYAVDHSSVSANDHNIWRTVDVSAYVPVGAQAVYVSGFLMISHGTTVETANLGVFFRRDAASESRTLNYISQCVEASVGNGQRSGCSTWVPLSPQRTFQFKWCALSPSGPVLSYPAYSAYGGNMRIVAAAGN